MGIQMGSRRKADWLTGVFLLASALFVVWFLRTGANPHGPAELHGSPISSAGGGSMSLMPSASESGHATGPDSLRGQGGRLQVSDTWGGVKGDGGGAEWGSIAFVNGSGLPVPGVEVYFSAAWQEVPAMAKANSLGVVSLDEEPKAGFALALAEGYVPIELEFRAVPVVVSLLELEELTLTVRWEGFDGAGVEGCEVRRSILVDGYSWSHDLISKFIPVEARTNADGECHFTRDLIEGASRMTSMLSITNPRGSAVLYTQRGLVAMAAERSPSIERLIVELPYTAGGSSEYTFTFLDASKSPIRNRDVRLRLAGGGDWHGETDQDGTATMVLALRDSDSGDLPLQGAEVSIQLSRDRLWSKVLRSEALAGDRSSWVFNVEYPDVRVLVRGAFPQDFEVASTAHEGQVAGKRLREVVMSTRWSKRLEWEPVDATGGLSLSSGNRGMRSLALLAHRQSGLIVDYAVLPDSGGEVTFELPVLGLVSLNFPSGQPSSAWSFSLLPPLYFGLGGGGIPMGGPPKMDANQLTMRLPVGEYLGSYSRGRSRLQMPNLNVGSEGLVVELSSSTFLEGNGVYRSLSGGTVEGDYLLLRYEDGSTCDINVGVDGSFYYSYPDGITISDSSVEQYGHVKWPVEVSFSPEGDLILTRIDGTLVVQRGTCGEEGTSAMAIVLASDGRGGSTPSISGPPVGSLSWGGSVEWSMFPGTYRVIWDVGPERFEQLVEVREGEVLEVIPRAVDLVVWED